MKILFHTLFFVPYIIILVGCGGGSGSENRANEPNAPAPIPNQLTFSGAEWFVAAGSNGSGSKTAPFGTIQEAIDAAQPGDGISILPGIYQESLSTRRNATTLNPIIIQSKEGLGTVTITANGRVVNVNHAYHTFSQLIFSGQYGTSDLIKVRTAATGWLLHNSEVKESSKDCIDLDSPEGVTITGSIIHHCLNAQNGRTDAHGVVGASIRNFLIQDTKIHTFSGDAFQVDPGRTTPGWDNVTIDGCEFWLEPLTSPTNGFAAGVVPGENGVDTKVRSGEQPKIKITNSSFWGFEDGLITNMSALNLKESINAEVDGVTIYNSDIAFRLRFPAVVRIKNTIIHSTQRAVRYEDNIAEVLIWNSTFGKDIGTFFQGASSSATTFNIKNTLLISNSYPTEVDSNQNLIVDSTHFSNVNIHNYQLKQSSSAVDSGSDLSIATDRYGTNRPLGSGVDIGAVESY